MALITVNKCNIYHFILLMDNIVFFIYLCLFFMCIPCKIFSSAQVPGGGESQEPEQRPRAEVQHDTGGGYVASLFGRK